MISPPDFIFLDQHGEDLIAFLEETRFTKEEYADWRRHLLFELNHARDEFRRTQDQGRAVVAPAAG